MKLLEELTKGNVGFTVNTPHEILECWVGDSKMNIFKIKGNNKWEVKIKQSDYIEGKIIFIKLSLNKNNRVPINSIEIK